MDKIEDLVVNKGLYDAVDISVEAKLFYPHPMRRTGNKTPQH